MQGPQMTTVPILGPTHPFLAPACYLIIKWGLGGAPEQRTLGLLHAWLGHTKHEPGLCCTHLICAVTWGHF